MALITCKECGNSVSDTAEACPRCGAKVVKDVYCPNCGTKLMETEKFCPKCGRKVIGGTTPAGKKDRIVTGILAILLGGLGIQYFYLGKIVPGIVSIVLTFCSVGIWSALMVVQGILILLMTDEKFEEKFVAPDKTFPLF